MRYTCAEYRAEMMLLGLEMRLKCEYLTQEERDSLVSEIRKLKESIGLD